MKKEELVNSLHENKFNCAVLKQEKVITSDENGIKPLLKWLDEDICFFEDSQVIDKIVGKAAALLFVLGKATAVYGKIMSDEAVAVLSENNIAYEFSERVSHIENRTKTDICPMEKTVLNISSPQEAYEALKAKVKELSGM